MKRLESRTHHIHGFHTERARCQAEAPEFAGRAAPFQLALPHEDVDHVIADGRIRCERGSHTGTRTGTAVHTRRRHRRVP
jgi:hypothetical protein